MLLERGPLLVVVSGNQGAGKTTIGRALAERFPRGVHIEGDLLQRLIVSGGKWPEGRDMSEGAERQLRLRLHNACLLGRSFLEAGFTAVVDDIVVGERLDHLLDELAGMPFIFVMLIPDPHVIRDRERSRGTKLFDKWAWLEDQIRYNTPRIGLWIDSSEYTVNQTVDTILSRAWEEGRVDPGTGLNHLDKARDREARKRRLVAAAERGLGHPIDVIEEIPVGRERLVLRCGSKVGPVVVKGDTPEMLTRFAMATGILAELDIPVPEILAMDRTGEAPFVVMREARGIDLETAGARRLPTKRSLHHLGELLARMHSIHFDEPGWFDPAYFPDTVVMHRPRLEEMRRDPWGLDYLVHERFIDEITAQNIRSYSSQRIGLFDEAPNVLVHGDLRFPHVFIDPDKERVVGIIDFGDLRSDHPAWDFTWFWIHAQEALPHILSGYRDAPTNLKAVLDLFGLQRLVGEATWLHQNGFPLGDRITRIAKWAS